MKTILLQSIDDKLFRNLSLCSNNTTKIITSIVDKNIYDLFYRYQFNYAILSSSVFNNVADNSVVQFAVEFSKNIKIIIVYDSSLSDDFMNDYNKLFTFVSSNQTNKIHTKLPDNLVNSSIYENSYNIPKASYISCFLDNINILPPELLDHLYPNSNKKIRLFNNPNIQHVQNLGTINEYDKCFILKESEFYLDLNGLYLTEALLSKCKILDIESLSSMSPKNLDKPQYTTYEKLIEELTL